jgi:membrane fusion protein (multidrug efflux system)
MRLKTLWKISTMIFLLVGLLPSGCNKKSEGGAAPIEMSVNVVGYKAVLQPISEKITLVGNLEAHDIVEIKSEIDGTVEEIKFEEGQKVKKGDLLIFIDRKKLEATLAQAEANLKMAEQTQQRYDSLVQTGAVSRQELEQAAAALEVSRAAVKLNKAEMHESVISAPFDGVMGERLISEGQFITKGTSLSFLISQDPMKAGFHVPERYLSRIEEGQAVEISVAAYPGETFKGEVYFIDPKIDEMTRTALVKAKLSNPEGKLRHGMFANLQVTVLEKPNAIVIPETALIIKGDDVQVFMVNDNQTAAIQPIKIGIRTAGFVEVTEGLAAGKTVVVEGYQKLMPGVKVIVRFEESKEGRPRGHLCVYRKSASTVPFFPW